MFHFITKEFSERPEGNDLLPNLQEQQSFRSFFFFCIYTSCIESVGMLVFGVSLTLRTT